MHLHMRVGICLAHMRVHVFVPACVCVRVRPQVKFVQGVLARVKMHVYVCVCVCISRTRFHWDRIANGIGMAVLGRRGSKHFKEFMACEQKCQAVKVFFPLIHAHSNICAGCLSLSVYTHASTHVSLRAPYHAHTHTHTSTLTSTRIPPHLLPVP